MDKRHTFADVYKRTFIIKTLNMRKTNLITLAIGGLLLMAPKLAVAQSSKDSKWTIIPRAGMAISTITGDADEDVDDAYGSRVGFGGGVEAEYHFNKTFGLSLGAFYTKLGSKVYIEMLAAAKDKAQEPYVMYEGDPDDFISKVTYGKDSHINIADYTDDYNHVEHIHNLKAALGYINIPLMLNVHLPLNIPVGVTVKAGAQMDILVSAKAKGDVQTYDNGNYGNTSYSNSIKDGLKDFGFTIPAGLAVSYKNIELDARYLWNVTNINDGSDYDEPSGKNHNSTFLITLGYNFKL